MHSSPRPLSRGSMCSSTAANTTVCWWRTTGQMAWCPRSRDQRNRREPAFANARQMWVRPKRPCLPSMRRTLLPPGDDMNVKPPALARPRSSFPRMSRLLGVLALFMIVAASCVTLTGAVPEGWMVAGSQPAKYEAGVDKTVLYEGHRSAYLKSKEQVMGGGFGTLIQSSVDARDKGSQTVSSTTCKTAH